MSIRPSLAELKQVWLQAYARTSLIEADNWIRELQRTDLSSEQRASLVCSALVAYARPFNGWQMTTNERTVPLGSIQPPPNLRDTHVIALKLRNKVLGHKDASPAKGDTETPNVVVLNFDKTGFNIHTIRVYDIDDEIRRQLHDLCAHFISGCDKELDTFVQKYGAELIKLRSGSYFLLLSESPAPWVQRFEPRDLTG